jgi:predicted transcriptional regulator
VNFDLKEWLPGGGSEDESPEENPENESEEESSESKSRGVEYAADVDVSEYENYWETLLMHLYRRGGADSVEVPVRSEPESEEYTEEQLKSIGEERNSEKMNEHISGIISNGELKGRYADKLMSQLIKADLIERTVGTEHCTISLTEKGFQTAQDVKNAKKQADLIESQNQTNKALAILTAILAFAAIAQIYLDLFEFSFAMSMRWLFFTVISIGIVLLYVIVEFEF